MDRVKKITSSSSINNFYKKRYYTIEEDYKIMKVLEEGGKMS